MSKLVLIDSQILIWGIKEYASPGQEPNIPRAKNFISWLSEEEYKILMPVPQLVELMSYVPVANQDSIRHLFRGKSFVIAPFDEMASSKCAELLYLSLNEPDLVKYRQEQAVAKSKIKYDCMIAAVAIVRGALKIYSHDTDMKRYANGQIDVNEMPVFTQQMNLFGSESITDNLAKEKNENQGDEPEF